MLQQTLTFFSRPLSRLLLHTLPLNNPWDRYAFDVPLPIYGAGATRDFAWFLEGESRVQVASLESILQWLSECDYARDPDLFNEFDYWQHPRTFEQLRVGDCEDFSLWAWRKLIELGYDAEFVTGRSLHGACPQTGQYHAPGHAWVQFRDEQTLYLLDPVIPDPAQMLRPLVEVQEAYLPEASVDGYLNRYAYVGYFQLKRGMLPIEVS